MRQVAVVIAAVLLFIGVMIANLPAIHVLARVNLPDNVSVKQASGTVWNGALASATVNGLMVKNITWQINPLPLLLGKLDINIKGGNTRDPEQFSFNTPLSLNLFDLNRVKATNAQVFVPVDYVIAQINLPLPVSAGGRLKVSFEQLDYGQQCYAMQGSGEWLNAVVAGTQGPISFGNFDASLSCLNGGVRAMVKEPNLLGLNLVLTATAQLQDIAVSGQFKIDDSLPQEVHQAGRFFGAPGADGYTVFKL